MDLSAAVARYRKHNDDVEASQRRERGSFPPPSSSTMPVAPVVLTPDRTAEISKLLASSIAMLTAATLIGLTAGEFVAFCKLKGSSK